MSLFFGFVTTDIRSNCIIDKMLNNTAFFEGDAVGSYQTDGVFICNKFLFNTPESVNTSQISKNERYVVAASCRIDNRPEPGC